TRVERAVPKDRARLVTLAYPPRVSCIPKWRLREWRGLLGRSWRKGKYHIDLLHSTLGTPFWMGAQDLPAPPKAKLPNNSNHQIIDPHQSPARRAHTRRCR